MSEQKSLSVIIPTDLPVDIEWLGEMVPRYLEKATEIVLLHVIDSSIQQKLQQSDVIDTTSILSTIRTSAEAQLSEAKHQLGSDRFNAMVVEGTPFLEILKISRDLQVDMIAMRIRSHSRSIEDFFFGSTAEQIIRGSSIPVFAFP